jgi:hypothetical protein
MAVESLAASYKEKERRGETRGGKVLYTSKNTQQYNNGSNEDAITKVIII